MVVTHFRSIRDFIQPNIGWIGSILLVWRRDIDLRSVIQSLTVAIIACLAVLQLVNDGVISNSWNILMTVFMLPTPFSRRNDCWQISYLWGLAKLCI